MKHRIESRLENTPSVRIFSLTDNFDRKKRRMLENLRSVIQQGMGFRVAITVVVNGKPPTVRVWDDECEEISLAVPKTEKISHAIVQSDVAVFFDDANSSGQIIGECQRLGIPMIAAVDQLVSLQDRSSSYGLVVKSLDCLQIAAAIGLILNNPKFRQQMIEFQYAARMERLAPHEYRELENRLSATPKGNLLLQGHFEGTYSLALVNNEIKRAAQLAGEQVNYFSLDHINIEEFAEFYPQQTGCDPAVTRISRLHYPPLTTGMIGQVRTYHCYGWEESSFPIRYVHEFNLRLSMVSTMSNYVSDVLITNGIRIPCPVVGLGSDHLARIRSDPEGLERVLGAQIVEFKKYKLIALHVSSGFVRKGVDILLAAWKKTCLQQEDAILIIKTFPSAENEIHQSMQSLGLANHPRIILLDQNISGGQLRALYDLADVLVAPSRGEGFGLPLAEAMRHYLPVITTDAGGQRDFCFEETVWLIDYAHVVARSHFGQKCSSWFEPDQTHLEALLEYFYQNKNESGFTEKIAKRVNMAFNISSSNICWRYVWAGIQKTYKNIEALPVFQTTPKVGWISTWNSRCGIADYSYRMTKRIKNLTVFSNKDAELLAADQSFVIRCWNTGSDDSLDDLFNQILDREIDVVVIQFNFSFFELGSLNEFIHKLAKRKVLTIIFLHSTDGRKESLMRLSSVLRGVARIFVHSVRDLNNLKKIGNDRNATLFPHGVDAYACGKVPSDYINLSRWQGCRVIATFGYLLPGKGLPELVEAFNIIRRIRSDTHLLMLTAKYPSDVSDQESQFINQLVSSQGLSDQVTIITDFLDIELVYGLLAHAQVIVFPYSLSTESTSAAARVGIACRKPVMVSNLSVFDNIREIVYTLTGLEPEKMSADILAFLDRETSDFDDACMRVWIDQHDWREIATRINNMLTGFFANREYLQHGFNGKILHIDEHSVEGWILDLNRPENPVVGDLFYGNHKIGRVFTDIVREDIELDSAQCRSIGFRTEVDWSSVECEFGEIYVVADGSWRKFVFIESFPLPGKKANKGYLMQPAGNLERLIKNRTLVGWIADLRDTSRKIHFLVEVDGIAVGTGIADRYREDLAQAGIGDGRHGFVYILPMSVEKQLKYSGGQIHLVLAQYRSARFGPLAIPPGVDYGPIFENHLINLCQRTSAIVKMYRKADEHLKPLVHGPVLTSEYNARSIKSKLVSTRFTELPDAVPGLNCFAEFMLLRCHFSDRPMNSIESYNKCMRWYLRHGKIVDFDGRLPLSKRDIVYYNGRINNPLIRRYVSRATFHFADYLDNIAIDLGINDEKRYQEMLYSWSVNVAYDLNVEDCLVPEIYAEQLRNLEQTGRDTPLNMFARMFYEKKIQPLINLEFDIVAEDNADRFLIYVIIILNALFRVDYVRYLAPEIVAQIFQECQNDGWFKRYLRRLVGDGSVYENLIWFFNVENFHRIIHQFGYDLYRKRFNTVDYDGNRVSSMVENRIFCDSLNCDVQIIGPMSKISGLGKAARVSVKAIERCGFSTNEVDFILDNPAPALVCGQKKRQELVNAKINLLHLNARDIPNVLALLPDFFSLSYNIGFLFWELETPSSCDFLALEILDEIWVASEFTKNSFEPYFTKPIVVMGTTIDEFTDYVGTAENSRNFRNEIGVRWNIPVNCIWFLCVFDSFSFIQRKNPIGVIKSFLAAFKSESVQLILKTHNRHKVSDPHQISLWNEIDHFVAGDDRIHLVNETLTDSELVGLIAASDVFVSLHKSEGWGYCMMEAMFLGVPVICTGWSGNMDFCDSENAWIVDYEMAYLNRFDYIDLVPGQRWAEAKIEHAASCMRESFYAPEIGRLKAANARTSIMQKFSFNQICDRYDARLRDILGNTQNPERF